MKRRGFFKGLGATAALMAVAPMTALTGKVYQAEIISEGNFKQKLLNHIFQEKPLSIEGGLWVRLYDEAGYESNYRSYAPQYMERDSEHWLVEANLVSNRKEISFPACTGRGVGVSMFGLSDSHGNIIYKGGLTSTLYVCEGVTPEFMVGSITIEES